MDTRSKRQQRAITLDPRAKLANTDILVASHHGRENGYCREVFDYCHPQAVVMSDKSIVHDTQLMAQVYHNAVIKHHPRASSSLRPISADTF
jgi:hypothetical protein